MESVLLADHAAALDLDPLTHKNDAPVPLVLGRRLVLHHRDVRPADGLEQLTCAAQFLNQQFLESPWHLQEIPARFIENRPLDLRSGIVFLPSGRHALAPDQPLWQPKFLAEPAEDAPAGDGPSRLEPRAQSPGSASKIDPT